MHNDHFNLGVRKQVNRDGILTCCGTGIRRCGAKTPLLQLLADGLQLLLIRANEKRAIYLRKRAFPQAGTLDEIASCRSAFARIASCDNRAMRTYLLS